MALIMIIEIPGGETLEIEYVVTDFNGTIAVDGVMKQSVKERLIKLSELFKIYVITSDTQGTAARELEGLPVELQIYNIVNAGECKRTIVDSLSCKRCCCIGNGRNDLLMFQAAALNIAVLEAEGTYAPLLKYAHLLVKSSEDAVDLLLDKKRLVSGLRG
jgi:soluble P-type ATPase